MYNNQLFLKIVIRPNTYNSFSFTRLCKKKKKSSIGVIISCWDELFMFRFISASAAGLARVCASSVQCPKRGQYGGSEGPTAPALPLLWPHVLLMETAEPQPQQPGIHTLKNVQTCLHRFIGLLWVCWTKPHEHWLWCCNHDSFRFQSCTSRYNAGTWGIVQGQLRPLLAPRVYTLPMVRSIGKTMVQGKNYGPQITVKRISTRSVM